MAVITRLFSRGTDDVIVRRAPKNMVYLIIGIYMFLQTVNVDNTIYILNKHMKVGGSPVMGVISTNHTPHLIFAFTGGADTGSQLQQYVGPIAVKTKYISVGFANSNNLTWAAIIYGDIVRETKTNLIWEFITKRHR